MFYLSEHEYQFAKAREAFDEDLKFEKENNVSTEKKDKWYKLCWF